ncbi:hypothetical protein CL617_00170 [archaeon]|nr:hypothetical protein [archaeon]|tara:strand:- start:4657 stop:5589 length:933 start_codon:yes stop_codon:yes gene_type:complete
MEKKRVALLFLLFGVILIVGCDDPEVPEKSGTFFGGNDGISASFVKVSPPSSFDQDDSVAVKVLLENKGETEIVAGNAKVKIHGINVNNFGLNSDYKATQGVLIGKSERSTKGGQQEIDFGRMQYSLPIINTEDFTIRARLCYNYQTQAKLDICLKSRISEEAGEEVCSLAGNKVDEEEGSVSSAPIQITSITEETRGSDQVRFDVKIENLGTGDVFDPSSSCEEIEDDSTRLEKRDKVEINVLNPADVKCSFITGEESNKGIVRLDNDEGTITCFMDVEETLEDKLSINLNYIYRDSVSKQITIVESTN